MSQMSCGWGKKKAGKAQKARKSSGPDDDPPPTDDDFRFVSLEIAAGMLGWSVKTLERHSAAGTGPKITKLGPRSRKVAISRIRRFTTECDEESAA